MDLLCRLLNGIKDLRHIHDGHDIKTVVWHAVSIPATAIGDSRESSGVTLDGMNWRAILQLRCPVCGKGQMFRSYLDTPSRCKECGFYFMRETGYFLPHAAIAYGATVLAAFSIWPILWLLGVRSDWIILVSMVAGGL